MLGALVGGCEASSRGQQTSVFLRRITGEFLVCFTRQACGFIDLAEHGRPQHLLPGLYTSSSSSWVRCKGRRTVIYVFLTWNSVSQILQPTSRQSTGAHCPAHAPRKLLCRALLFISLHRLPRTRLRGITSSPMDSVYFEGEIYTRRQCRVSVQGGNNASCLATLGRRLSGEGCQCSGPGQRRAAHSLPPSWAPWRRVITSWHVWSHCLACVPFITPRAGGGRQRLPGRYRKMRLQYSL